MTEFVPIARSDGFRVQAAGGMSDSRLEPKRACSDPRSISRSIEIVRMAENRVAAVPNREDLHRS